MYLAIILAFIGIAFYIVNSGCHTSAAYAQVGAPEDMGSDEDADARYHYDLTMLCDPATGMIPAHIRERELAFAAMLPKQEDFALSRTSTIDLPTSWVPRGPWNVGGRTRAFAIDVSNENNLIAGSTSGDVWRSTDGGLTWHTTTPATGFKNVSCLVQDTRRGHTNVWYYGTGEASGASASGSGAFYAGNGIYKSTDGGASWHVLPSTVSASVVRFDQWSDIVSSIAVNPADSINDVLYAAGTYSGIYKSTDGGTSWNAVINSSGSYYAEVVVSKTGVIYATLSSDGSGRGIYRSTDGVTFTDITPDSFPTIYNRVKIAISPSDENQVFFLGNTPGHGMPDTSYSGTVEWNSLWKYTYISGDGSDTGGHWSDRSANLPSTGGPFDKFMSQGSYDLVVKVKPNDTNVVFIGGTNLYRSTSGFADNTHTTFIGGYQQGATLPVVNNYLNHHPDQHELVFFPGNPNKMISTNDGGIFYSNDNTVPSIIWRPLNNGYMTSMFYSCAIDHASTNDIIIGGAQDNGSWYTNNSDPTRPWVTPRGGDGSFCAIADYGKAFYFSIQNGKVMRARLSYSGHLDSFARIDPAAGHGYLFINPFVLDPNNNDIMYLAGGKSLWRNNSLSGIPYASNWDSISTNWTRFPDSTATFTQPISAIAVSTKPANRVYFGTQSQRVFRIDSANTGTHAFHNITSTATGNVFPGGNVSCIAVDPTNADNIMVVFSNYNVNSLFYSSDGGVSWKKEGGNLEANNRTGTGDGPSCRWASIIPVAGGTIYLVGTSTGLYATTQLNDTSTVWVQQGASTIGNAVVDMIDYRLNDGTVVVATHTGGIYSAHIPNTVVSVKEAVTADPVTNFVTFPNPFNSRTTVQFNLQQSANVTIEVYNLMGIPVRTIANARMSAGLQTYQFDANDLPSGTYYCTLKANGNTDTRKILLLK